MAGIRNDVFFGSGLILTDDGAGAQDVIQITPVTAIGGVEWKGIDLDASNIDPTATGATLVGADLNLSGVSLANDPIMDGLLIQMPSPFSGVEEKHGIRVEGFGSTIKICDGDDNRAISADGEIHIDFDASGLAAAEIVTVFDGVVALGTATDGHVHALDISTSGTGSVEVIAVSTHPGVDVIHQHIGTSGAIDQGWIELGAGGFTDSTAAFNAAVPDLAIFVNNTDMIYIGMTASFDHLDVVLDTIASKDLRPDFAYSTGAGFSAFSPSDETNGFQQNGSIFWDSTTLAGFAARVVNGSANLFFIRITRDRAGALTNPIESTIQALSATEFEWSAAGDIEVNSVLAGISNTGATNTIKLQNPSDTASSSSQIEVSVGGISAGDPWVQWSVGATQSWSAGIHNSDSDKFKITTDGDATVDPSSGTEVMVSTVAGAISFPNASLTEHGVMIGGASGLLATTAVGNAAQVLTSNGAGNDPTFQAPASGGGGTLGTPQLTTSGTTKLFTGISSSAKMILFNLDQVSLSAVDELTLQIGDAGGLEAAGYVGVTEDRTGGSATWNTFAQLSVSSTSGDTRGGIVTLTLLDSSTNTWSISVSVSGTASDDANFGSGSKSLSATLDRIQLAATGGDTFDNGKVNILVYE
ncbi:hypothetical protein LCGC14_0457060 [marine sediment metagenome]|uniref:Uncharacterized protein n=1 Tax=marine sediment metagenome TaxID=412755 RepID=A0A0F9SLL1_9ZZZZ|nr:hypothetical protein [Candidatus Aminicenantes bacterium]